MARHLRSLWQDEGGAVGVEYSMLMALVVVAALVSWKGLGCATAWTAFRAAARVPVASPAR